MTKRIPRSTSVVVMLCLLVLLVACAYFYEVRVSSPAPVPTSFQSTPASTIGLDGKVIHIFVADTDAERELGLGGMNGLAPDQGMLFVFPEDGEYAFWMKDMSFSIDMVWIADNGTIVFIAPDVSPATYPENFVPTSPARYVLELPANYAKDNGVKVGDIVHL